MAKEYLDDRGRRVNANGDLLNKDGTPRKKPGPRTAKPAAAAPKRRGRPPGSGKKAGAAAPTGAKRGPKPKPTSTQYKIYVPSGDELSFVATVAGPVGAEAKAEVAKSAVENGIVVAAGAVNLVILAIDEVTPLGVSPQTSFVVGEAVEIEAPTPVPAADPEVTTGTEPAAPKRRGSKPTPATPVAEAPAAAVDAANPFTPVVAG